jgi:bisphosphoglycerate-dependent phosphoglycerate mutase
MAHLIRAIAFANGMRCPHAGQWLESFDHEAHNGRGYATFTKTAKKAMKFDSFADAMEFWKRQSKVRPKRPDGEPNRPFTALTVSIEQEPRQEQADAKPRDVPA